MSDLLGFSLFPEFNFRRITLLAKLYKNNFLDAWQNLNLEDLTKLGLNQENASRILAEKKKISLVACQEKLNQLKITPLDIFSAAFPEILKEIYDPPILLYKKGPLAFKNFSGLAVVGTRKPSAYGLKATEKIVSALSEAQIAIVSGLALGIDTAAHSAALKNNIPTVAVLGTGLDLVYPRENNNLFAQIAEQGAVLSEYPLAVKPSPWNFPRRNRIITGLCQNILVMEGSLKSGALISGKIALAQNREVYALPGQIFQETAAGTNWLIEQGAKPLLGSEQLINDLLPGKQLSFKNSSPKAENIYLNSEEKIIYNTIEDKNYSIDDLLEKTTWDYPVLIKTLTSLELKGLVAQLPGKRIYRT